MEKMQNIYRGGHKLDIIRSLVGRGITTETVLIFVGKIFKRSTLGLGQQEGWEDTSHHEECKNLKTGVIF